MVFYWSLKGMGYMGDFPRFESFLLVVLSYVAFVSSIVGIFSFDTA